MGSEREQKRLVKRITLFKVVDEEDIEIILAQYEIVKRTAQKHGQPYLLDLEYGKIYNSSEPRAQGFTIAVQTSFASREAVIYWDTECEAHKALKRIASPKHQGVCSTMFEIAG